MGAMGTKDSLEPMKGDGTMGAPVACHGYLKPRSSSMAVLTPGKSAPVGVGTTSGGVKVKEIVAKAGLTAIPKALTEPAARVSRSANAGETLKVDAARAPIPDSAAIAGETSSVKLANSPVAVRLANAGLTLLLKALIAPELSASRSAKLGETLAVSALNAPAPLIEAKAGETLVTKAEAGRGPDRPANAGETLVTNADKLPIPVKGAKAGDTSALKAAKAPVPAREAKAGLTVVVKALSALAALGLTVERLNCWKRPLFLPAPRPGCLPPNKMPPRTASVKVSTIATMEIALVEVQDGFSAVVTLVICCAAWMARPFKVLLKMLVKPAGSTGIPVATLLAAPHSAIANSTGCVKVPVEGPVRLLVVDETGVGCLSRTLGVVSNAVMAQKYGLVPTLIGMLIALVPPRAADLR